jgi:RNA polymerase sigma-70 factor (ECF subfamily)
VPPSTPDDDDIADAARAAEGDADAFARLYHRHAPRVRATARWMLRAGGESDVDDAVQEVFIRVWRKLHLFAGTSTFGAWLGRVTVNVVLRHRTTRHRYEERLLPADAAEGGVAGAPGRAPTGDWAIDIEAAVAALPRRAREVFVLHDVQGLQHDEIAALLGITASTSRSQLVRARLALRHWFADPRPAELP